MLHLGRRRGRERMDGDGMIRDIMILMDGYVTLTSPAVKVIVVEGAFRGAVC
jgi:hypothetical protein